MIEVCSLNVMAEEIVENAASLLRCPLDDAFNHAFDKHALEKLNPGINDQARAILVNRNETRARESAECLAVARFRDGHNVINHIFASFVLLDDLLILHTGCGTSQFGLGQHKPQCALVVFPWRNEYVRVLLFDVEFRCEVGVVG